VTQVSRSGPKASEDQPEERRPVVLVVDDEPRIVSSLLRVLRREGYELLSAERPEDALRLVEVHAIDCVLSDYKMPAMMGTELLERIAKRRPSAARVLLTGWTQEIDRDALARLGVHAVLSKPWDDGELKRTLRKAMGLVEPDLD
jgi:response regulator RpfG family c-di-GMP phosphodiesterase